MYDSEVQLKSIQTPLFEGLKTLVSQVVDGVDFLSYVMKSTTQPKKPYLYPKLKEFIFDGVKNRKVYLLIEHFLTHDEVFSKHYSFSNYLKP